MKYEVAEMEVALFDVEEVIATSATPATTRTTSDVIVTEPEEL